VVGVAAPKGTVLGFSQDNFATIPLKTYVKKFGPPVEERSLFLTGTAKDDNLFPEAVEEVRMLLRSRRGLKSQEKDNFGVSTPDAISGMRDRVLGPAYLIAIAVPGIGLLVAGIVIMNIMLVSVTERTREIGIRKAIGARRRDIMWQFLIEAMMLTGLGGLIGLAIGGLTSFGIKAILPSYVPAWAPMAGLLSSVGIGLIFGLWPAWKAASLDPIEALRYE
jgi:putative ABC transport system permease protein